MKAVFKLPRLDTAITFSNADLEGYQHPHDGPLVIRVVVANKTVHRVLINNNIIHVVFLIAGQSNNMNLTCIYVLSNILCS